MLVSMSMLFILLQLPHALRYTNFHKENANDSTKIRIWCRSQFIVLSQDRIIWDFSNDLDLCVRFPVGVKVMMNLSLVNKLVCLTSLTGVLASRLNPSVFSTQLEFLFSHFLLLSVILVILVLCMYVSYDVRVGCYLMYMYIFVYNHIWMLCLGKNGPVLKIGICSIYTLFS